MRAYHSLIHGPSGEGKSTLGREVASNTPAPVIWINHNDEKNVPGQRASGREAMHTAAGKYSQWADVRVNLRVEDPITGLRQARSYAVDLWDTGNVPCRIIVDEAHAALPDGVDGDRNNPANWILAQGRDKGIALTLITQNPHKLDKTELLNLRYWCIVGKPANVSRGFLDYYGYPERSTDQEAFEYMVMNKQMEVLYEAETKERFS